jgi:hypothetical protein
MLGLVQNMRCLENGESISVDGTHLGDTVALPAFSWHTHSPAFRPPPGSHIDVNSHPPSSQGRTGPPPLTAFLTFISRQRYILK